MGMLAVILAFRKPAARVIRPALVRDAVPSISEVRVSAGQLDLTPGTNVVVQRQGLFRVVGTTEHKGRAHLELEGESATILLDTDRALGSMRALISREEADRRLELLRDATIAIDERPWRKRYIELARTRARGTEDEILGMLRRFYASPFQPGFLEKQAICELEQLMLPEIALVRGRTTAQVVEELHAAHAKHGTFGPTARTRPPEPAPQPPAKDPWKLRGLEYIGQFTLTSDRMVVGDPGYTRSHHDESDGEVRKSYLIDAVRGNWYAYVELDSDGDQVCAFLAIHETAVAKLKKLRKQADPVGKLWVDSGQMSVLDAAIRDDNAYDDALFFGADDNGIIGDRGAMTAAFGGDGTFGVRACRENGLAALMIVEFS